MKKELRIFLIILIGWLALLDFAILRNVITKSISNYRAIIVKNLMSGAAVYYPADSQSMVNALVIPLLVFNALIIIFLSMSYYFWIKSKNRLNINKKMSGKKGQAAMEFMMTYGWAVMALVVSIAALAYFGVFTNFSPTGKAICALSPGFNCKEFIVGPGGVMMTIQNNLGVNINTVSLNITNSPQGPCNESVPPKNLQNGMSDNFYVPCLKIGSVGQQFKGDIKIKYKKDNAVLNDVANGMINAKTENYTYNDTEAPIINLIEPRQGQVYEGYYINLIYTVSDYSFTRCIYGIDKNDLRFMFEIPNCENRYFLMLGNTSNGTHMINLTAYDSNSNINSVQINFTSGRTDNILPWPHGGYQSIWDTVSNYGFRSVPQYSIVNFTSDWEDDQQIDGCIFSITFNNSFGWQNSTYISPFLPEGYYYPHIGFCRYNSLNITAPPYTYISYKFYAYDNSGNMNTSYTAQFRVSEPVGGGDGGGSCGNECAPIFNPFS
jgi:hypothetical protein